MMLHDDFKQASDLARPVLRICGEVSQISIEERLIDARQIAGPVHVDSKLKEAPRPVEQLADANRRQSHPKSWNIEVKPGVKELTQRPFDTSVLDTVEVHRVLALARVLAKHRRRQIPAAVLEARQR
jgi:hypothetical protein